MILAIYLATMAFANRWRGGGWPFLPTEVHGGPNDHKRTQVRRIVFAAIAGLLAWPAPSTYIPLPFTDTWLTLPASLSVFVVLYLSTLTGWGFPVSAATGKRKATDWEAEWKLLDDLARKMTRHYLGTYHAQSYGVAWLTLHGAFFGTLLSILTLNPCWVLLSTMGLVYAGAKDWERAEWVFGALIGLTLWVAVSC